MKMNLSPQQLITNVAHFIHRYHVMIFVVMVVGGLAWANFMINKAVSQSATDEPQSTSSSFDQETMEKINQLNENSDKPTEFSLPSGRTNPFI